MKSSLQLVFWILALTAMLGCTGPPKTFVRCNKGGSCVKCQGHKWYGCTQCEGLGNKACNDCKQTGKVQFGDGMVDCFNCGGETNVKCRTCKGKGRIECGEYVLEKKGAPANQ
jgi:hypothetical protein